MYDCSREEAVFILVGRGGDLFIFEFLAANWIPSKESQLTRTHFIQHNCINKKIKKVRGYDQETMK